LKPLGVVTTPILKAEAFRVAGLIIQVLQYLFAKLAGIGQEVVHRSGTDRREARRSRCFSSSSKII